MTGMRHLPLVILLCAAACQPTRRTVGEPPGDVTLHDVRLVPHDKVDILFMIDDSLSMLPKQVALQQRFPSLLANAMALADTGLPASYHIGVITSDLGADPKGTVCQVGGDGAVLQVRPPATMPLPAACAGFALGGGARFIEWNAATGESNVMGADVPTAFSCMASVGSTGCGIESQLESVYRALHDPPPENAGFLRDDALLVVVLLTDEDDCSAPPDTDLFDASMTAYGPLTSFRCTQFGVSCGGAPLDGGGTFGDCAPRPTSAGGKLFDVGRYLRLFAADRAHGGVKDDPNDVVVVSLAAPPSPFAVELSQPGVAGCPAGSALPCATLEPSCVNASDSSILGDPAVRIHAVVSALGNSVESSICDGDYGQAIDAAMGLMGERMRPGCLPGALVEPDSPDCTVTMVTADGSQQLPSCHAAPSPCWDVSSDPECPAEIDPAGRPQHLRLAGYGIPDGAQLSAQCLLFNASL